MCGWKSVAVRDEFSFLDKTSSNTSWTTSYLCCLSKLIWMLQTACVGDSDHITPFRATQQQKRSTQIVQLALVVFLQALSLPKPDLYPRRCLQTVMGKERPRSSRANGHWKTFLCAKSFEIVFVNPNTKGYYANMLPKCDDWQQKSQRNRHLRSVVCRSEQEPSAFSHASLLRGRGYSFRLTLSLIGLNFEWWASRLQKQQPSSWKKKGVSMIPPAANLVYQKAKGISGIWIS